MIFVNVLYTYSFVYPSLYQTFVRRVAMLLLFLVDKMSCYFLDLRFSLLRALGEG